jgi:hypothetical protein
MEKKKRKLTPKQVAGMLITEQVRKSPAQLRQDIEMEQPPAKDPSDFYDDDDLLDDDDCPAFDDMSGD